VAHELVSGLPISVEREIVDWYYRRGNIVNLGGFILTTGIRQIRAPCKTEINLRGSAAAYGRLHIGIRVRWDRKT
jgi:hypothetical protein